MSLSQALNQFAQNLGRYLCKIVDISAFPHMWDCAILFKRVQSCYRESFSAHGCPYSNSGLAHVVDSSGAATAFSVGLISV